MTDAELIARLRKADEYEPLGHDGWEAADRIEALTVESARRLALARSEGVARVEQFERAEALTEQLAAARQDAKEAEAYAEELEEENRLMKTAGIIEVAVRNPSVMEYMKQWEGRVEALEAKLAKAVEALGLIVVDNTWGLEHETYMKCRATLAEIKGESQ